MSEDRNIELYTKQMIFGVIPEELWNYLSSKKSSLVTKYSPAELRRLNRKFRKLKRKSGVKQFDSSRTMWKKINSYLKRIDL